MKPDSLPHYCIRNAVVSDVQLQVVADSWACCLQGTAAWRGHAGVVTTATHASVVGSTLSQAIAASNLGSSNSRRAVVDTPVAFFYDTFYSRLFEVVPSVRPLFKNNMVVQGRKLVRMVGMAISLLTDADKLVPTLQSLAKRHVSYGARVDYYGPVGEVLLYALERCCGPAVWTPQVSTAWLTVYSAMMAVMIPAALEEEAAVAATSSPKSWLSGSFRSIKAVSNGSSNRYNASAASGTQLGGSKRNDSSDASSSYARVSQPALLPVASCPVQAVPILPELETAMRLPDRSQPENAAALKPQCSPSSSVTDCVKVVTTTGTMKSMNTQNEENCPGPERWVTCADLQPDKTSLSFVP